MVKKKERVCDYNHRLPPLIYQHLFDLQWFRKEISVRGLNEKKKKKERKKNLVLNKKSEKLFKIIKIMLKSNSRPR